MTKPLKIVLITLSVLIVLAIVGYFVADAVVSSKLEKFLKTGLPETVSVDYESLDFNVWQGSAIVVKPKIINKGSHTSKTNTEIEMDTLVVEGFGYWNYLVNDTIHIESIQLRSPKLLYNHNKSIPKNEYKYSKLEQLKQEIKIDRFNVQNGEISIKDIETDSILLHTNKVTANVMSIFMDKRSVKRRIPFNYKNYNLSFNELFYSVGDYEHLKIASAKITQNKASFDALKLYTKYTKSKFDQIIKVERDHFDVSIASLVLDDQEFGYEQDSVFYFKSPRVTIETPAMDIYRNKLIADDVKRKSLYSKMLRELTFNLTLNTIDLKDASIIYSEKVNADMPSGKISFTKMNADIKNISNTYGASEKTTVNIDAVFMDKTPINVDWNFDVNDVNDSFVFKADIGNLPAPDLNPFAQPNLKVKFEGELVRTYATVSGNANTSMVDMRTKYDNFKVNVLEKDGKNKNRFLSTIANLFIKKDSDKSEDGFREGTKEGVERDHTKSVFNFIWLSLRAGLISVMTGDGKK